MDWQTAIELVATLALLLFAGWLLFAISKKPRRDRPRGLAS
jgi:hypothetical protein